jgi:hypothetical protein
MVQLEVKGLDGLIKKFDQLAKETQVGVNLALEAWANKTAQDAIQLVSANSSDEGGLKNSIKPSHGNGYGKVTATSRYAAYIEFGTRKFAASYVSTLPSDWASYAATFKGRAGGTFEEFLLSIMKWCGRKGIDQDAAYSIARSIMINGIRPKPYLYPSVNKNLPLLIKDIKAIFK